MCSQGDIIKSWTCSILLHTIIELHKIDTLAITKINFVLNKILWLKWNRVKICILINFNAMGNPYVASISIKHPVQMNNIHSSTIASHFQRWYNYK